MKIKKSNKLKKVPELSEKEIKYYLKCWKKEGYTIEDAIIYNVCEKLSGNHLLDEVYYKVKIINYLYHAGLPEKYTRKMAEHICDISNIDEKIKKQIWDNDCMVVVEEIAKLNIDNRVTRRYLSFASKYCSFHNPDIYPIYDKYVLEVLWVLKNHLNYETDTTKKEMQQDYIVFSKIAIGVMRQSPFIASIKQQDQYFWMFGKKNWNSGG